MARPEKVAVVEEIRTKVAEADATVLTEYRGLTVDALARLRGSLRATGTEYKVFKNTLARRAVAGGDLESITSLFVGPVAIAFVRGDAAAAAKALREFGKGNPVLVLKGGLLGTRVITPADLAALADLPSREVMLAQVAGVFQAPLTKAAGLFQAFTRNLAYGVKALIDKRVEGGEAAPPAEAEAEVEVEETAAEPAAEAEAEAPATEAAPEAEAEAPAEAEAEVPEAEQSAAAEEPAAAEADAAPPAEAPAEEPAESEPTESESKSE